MPDTWKGSHKSTHFWVTGMTQLETAGSNPQTSHFWSDALPQHHLGGISVMNGGKKPTHLWMDTHVHMLSNWFKNSMTTSTHCLPHMQINKLHDKFYRIAALILLSSVTSLRASWLTKMPKMQKCMPPHQNQDDDDDNKDKNEEEEKLITRSVNTSITIRHKQWTHMSV